MTATLLSLAFLAALAWLGVRSAGRLAPWLHAFERWVYGAALGAVIGSLALLALAPLVGFGAPLVVTVAIGSVAGGWKLGRRAVGPESPALSPVALVVLGAFVAWFAWFWATAFTRDEVGLWAGQINLWGDWAQHIGDVSSFAYADNFPPRQVRFLGAPLAYHHLTAVTAAALVELGMSPWAALMLHSFVFSVVVLLSLYVLGLRLTARRSVSLLAVTLFLLGGGLGWTVPLMDALRDGGLEWANLWDREAQRAANYRFLNVFFSGIAPQRAYLYGLPLFGLILSSLSTGVSNDERRPFVVAGIAAGLLPFAHLGTMLALALATPFMFLLFPRRRWFWFFALWVTIAVPQLLVQQGGQPGALSALRWAPGWVAAPDPWVGFWLRNLGLLPVLLVVGLIGGGRLRSVQWRLLLAFMPLFVVANLVVFQPWDWDNTKILVFWYLAACMFAAAAWVDLWRRTSSAWTRVGLGLALSTLLLSGLLQAVHQVAGFDRHLLLRSEELRVARCVRERTPPRSTFVTGSKHNHPVSVLAGRTVVMGFEGWLWSQGYDYGDRQSEVRAIYELRPEASRYLEKFGVDFIVVGPTEREEFDVDLQRMRARFEAVIRTADHEVFAVEAESSAPAAEPHPCFEAVQGQGDGGVDRVKVDEEADDGRDVRGDDEPPRAAPSE